MLSTISIRPRERSARSLAFWISSTVTVILFGSWSPLIRADPVTEPSVPRRSCEASALQHSLPPRQATGLPPHTSALRYSHANAVRTLSPSSPRKQPRNKSPSNHHATRHPTPSRSDAFEGVSVHLHLLHQRQYVPVGLHAVSLIYQAMTISMPSPVTIFRRRQGLIGS